MAATASESCVVTQLPRDPRGRDAASSAIRPTTLSEEGLAGVTGRVRIAALISGVLWTLVLIANVLLAPLFEKLGFAGAAGWRFPNAIYAIIGVAGAFGLAWAITRFRVRSATVIDLGLGLEVFTALLIALITFYKIEPHASRISWTVAVILIYPAIAPAAPRRALLAGILAATMDAVGFGVAVLRNPEDEWSAVVLAWMLAPSYLCAFLALVPATLIRRLGREAGAARELGSYRLGRLLDRGGMGEVYEARHRMIAKPAAIKLIRPELLAGTPAFADMVVERFYREAEAVAALRSPHTVALFDFGVATDGTLYYVMELLDGIDLQRLVERFGPLPPERVVHILTQVCDSLSEAHAHGMVHRDIKPSNILVCSLGTTVDFVKVLDFGLVRHDVAPAPGDEGLSVPLGQPGTPSYMAPETVSGSAPVDRRADLYALACVGYWLLTGHPVFEGSSPVQIMYHHGYDPPMPPSERLGTPLPIGLETAILRALSKLPSDRPSTAADFSEQISAIAPTASWDTSRAQAWWAENLGAVRAARTSGIPA
ncbi:MAG TPA: serine/threonine-protein kinase [Gemmatimonadales bacterium]|nr:serine/threonine-protein kinase [Gemmatimonadales bacterium]